MLHAPFSRFAMQIIFVREVRARLLREIDTLQSICDRNICEIDAVGCPTVSFVSYYFIELCVIHFVTKI